MSLKLPAACILAALSMACAAVGPPPLLTRQEDFRALLEKAESSASVQSGRIDLGTLGQKEVEFDFTTKGNGTLRLGERLLKIYDAHDDGAYYKGDMLSIHAIDLNGDGVKDLVLTGIAVLTGEKETDPSSETEVVAIYEYTKSDGEFHEVFRNVAIPVTIR